MKQRDILAIFLIAFAGRAGWGTWRLANAPQLEALEFPDEQQYWLMAESIADGHGLRDELGFRATRMPLYPAVLSVFAFLPNGIVAAKLAHWALGSAAAVLAFWLGSVMAGRRVGRMAGIIVACDPFLLFFSSLLLTETPFIVALLLLTLQLWRAVTNHQAKFAPWLAAAACGIACVYLRESSLGLILLLYTLAAVASKRRGPAVLSSFITALLLVASLVPWAIRNKVATGEFIWLTTRSGISLYDGVGPSATGASDLAQIKHTVADLVGQDEGAWNRWFEKESFQAIRNDPGRIARLAWVKFQRTWSPTPNAEGYRGGVVARLAGVWSLGLYALGAAGALLLIFSPHRVRIPGAPLPQAAGGMPFPAWFALALLLLPAAYLTGLHMLFVGSVRYRLPAMPMIAILAGYAIVACIHRLKSDITRAAP